MKKKILVLQLARLGDIYQTWPVLRALKRQNPGVEVHLLTRESFSAASEGLAAIDRLWTLESRQILTPLIDEKPRVDEAIAKLSAFCEQLQNEHFERIINLSFSPFSSYLTSLIATPQCRCSGYTRFSDGYLAIPDDGSAYFYAQVGPGRANRLHLTDLFAHVSDVQLEEKDWAPESSEKSIRLAILADHAVRANFIAVHLGASQLTKTLSWSKWMQVLRLLLQTWAGDVVLLGSKDEIEFSNQASALSGPRQCINLVGKTTLPELQQIIGAATLLIGGDSAPMHIAGLTATRVLNLSLKQVSYWETGPRSKGSRILPMENETSILAEEIVDEAMAVIESRLTSRPHLRVLGPTLPYLESRPQPRAFEWELLRALYMGEPFPAAPDDLFLIGLTRLADVNLLAVEQIEALRITPQNRTVSQILDRADEIMDQLAEMVPEISPLVRWFKTERLRIGPAPLAEISEQTLTLHSRLAQVISLYLVPPAEKGVKDDNVHVD